MVEKLGDLIDPEVSVAIVSTVKLEEIKMKDLRWTIKLRIGKAMPEVRNKYRITLDLDEQPYLDRIEDLESQLRGSLFEHDPAQRKQVDQSISEIKKTLKERQKECESIHFVAASEKAEYGRDTVIVFQVPDDIIEAFNRQKSRLNYYKITLDVLYA